MCGALLPSMIRQTEEPHEFVHWFFDFMSTKCQNQGFAGALAQPRHLGCGSLTSLSSTWHGCVCIHSIPSPGLDAKKHSIPLQSVRHLQICEDVKCTDLQHDLIFKLKLYVEKMIQTHGFSGTQFRDKPIVLAMFELIWIHSYGSVKLPTWQYVCAYLYIHTCSHLYISVIGHPNVFD